MTTFKTTVWSNRNPNKITGSGYGIRIPKRYRDSLFKKEWNQVEIIMDNISHFINVTPSFWRKCNEIRSSEIGKWLIKKIHINWQRGKPNQILVEYIGKNQFKISIP